MHGHLFSFNTRLNARRTQGQNSTDLNRNSANPRILHTFFILAMCLRINVLCNQTAIGISLDVNLIVGVVEARSRKRLSAIL